ncbi:Uncharacterized protein CLAVI_000333 [Candidatus Clavichlamydia salmonicola]|uniref:penicillin-binding transpeptidase domain-containing protein n=1 Tax=Candidatus Clavichlamydia salmonicola TaxID=469812 RepID=UPI0018918B1B|nr:penicillin-binding transpeptidase domain-containing protein [Candidatus Clavichlamydia salmonicola]MBF5050715.1 Uncharacterized protein [Candidatus Clavichlamydia salmonicola]
MKHKEKTEKEIVDKANRLLSGVFICFFLIGIRIWCIAVIQHEKKTLEAHKPQKRTVIERAERAPIYDCNEVLLAGNTVRYDAAVNYSAIGEMPRWVWLKDAKGRRNKFFFRKQYISRLAKLLGEELNSDPVRLEDIIYAKAAVAGNIPFVIKENIGAATYFHLKMLEKEWPGIHAEIRTIRYYPLGMTAAEIIGYTGPISKEDFDQATKRVKELRRAIIAFEEGEPPFWPRGITQLEEAQREILVLERRVLWNDSVGKIGIEAFYDGRLRGIAGKREFLVDRAGNFVQELSESESPCKGQALMLSLSADLQAYGEELLLEREERVQNKGIAALSKNSLEPIAQPWIRGGAIVALDPSSGAVLAMSSFPRFDPNDFIKSAKEESFNEQETRPWRIAEWLESPTYIGAIWDLQAALTRERKDILKNNNITQKKELTWSLYCDLTLAHQGEVRQFLEKNNKLSDALIIRSYVKKILAIYQSVDTPISSLKILDFLFFPQGDNVAETTELSQQERKFLERRKEEKLYETSFLIEKLDELLKPLSLNSDKLLVADLYGLCLDERRAGNNFLEIISDVTLDEHRQAEGCLCSIESVVKEIVQGLFEEFDFKTWREEEFPDFLACQRRLEKKKGVRYPLPYIEYLDKNKKEFFKAFWETYKERFLLAILLGNQSFDLPIQAYESVLHKWHNELVSGAHSGLFWTRHFHIFRALLKKIGGTEQQIEYLRLLRSFDELDRDLLGSYRGGITTEKGLALSFYPVGGFGFARSHAFRQAVILGSVFKLMPAYAALTQQYQKMAPYISSTELNPLIMTDDKRCIDPKNGKWIIGFSQKGDPIPTFYKGGRLPKSEGRQPGLLDLKKALEVSSNPYFSLLAGEVLDDSEDLYYAAQLFGFGEKTGIDLPGEYGGYLPEDSAYNRSGLYAFAIGQHSLVATPLQTAVMLSALVNGGTLFTPKLLLKEKNSVTGKWRSVEPQIKRRIYLPAAVQRVLLEGMQQVIQGEKGTARGLKELFSKELLSKIIGKTSTAETMIRLGPEKKYGIGKLKHVWFSAAKFEDESLRIPKIVVVVYLKYGSSGAEAAPLAIKMIKKWEELQKKN